MIRRHINKVRGVKGAKPRGPRNGDRSKADAEYLTARNRQITAWAKANLWENLSGFAKAKRDLAIKLGLILTATKRSFRGIVPSQWDLSARTPIVEQFITAPKAPNLVPLTGVVSPMAGEALTARGIKFSEKQLPNPLK